ncbi:MAG: shikimate dehydrogenase [Thermodesulfovibrionales bacterium]
MKIGARTRVTALLGYPVEHSLSPAMHNAAFESLGLDYCYVAFPVRPDRLRDAVAAIRALPLAGANVTVPHKENVMPLLDEIDSEAAFIGAVNTVVNRGGRLLGYNTDGRGFMKGLEEAGVSVEGKNVLIVGAGGGSRAISYYISEKASGLSLFDIDADKAARLAHDLGVIRTNVRRLDALSGLDAFDVVINATPLGLKESDPLPFDAAALGPEQVAGDLIYRETPLLRTAAGRGCRTFHGLGMLLWQGVLAFELWTGQSPPHELMRKVLLEGMARR